MENQKLSPAKFSLPLGLMYGLVLVLIFIVVYVMGIDPVTNTAYKWVNGILSNLILPFLFIYIGCNNFKQQNGGYISFGKCLAIGVGICAIAGLIGGIFSVVFNGIFPEYAEEVFSKTRDQMIEQQPEMTEEQLDMALSMMKKMQAWYIIIPFYTAITAFVGLIHSLIVGAIVKKDRPAL